MAGVVKIKGIEFDLAGEIYVLPPALLGTLEVMDDRLQALMAGVDKGRYTTIIDLAHASLKRNYPGLTRDQVAELIDASQMNEIILAAMDVSGVRRKQIVAEKAAEAAGKAEPATPAT